MKRILLLSLIFNCFVSFGQIAYGNYTMFPDNKFKGSSYKPQIAFGIIDETPVISLYMCFPDTYASFDENSRILVKFYDDSVTKLPIVPEIEVHKDYGVQFVSSIRLDYYKTVALFVVTDEFLDKVLNVGMFITKIRVVRANETANDYEISKQYQETLIKGLRESYQIAAQIRDQKKQTMTDADF